MLIRKTFNEVHISSRRVVCTLIFLFKDKYGISSVAMGQSFKLSLWIFVHIHVFLTSGCILHGSCIGVCSCLSPIQNPQGRMFSTTGSLPRSTVCSKVSIFKAYNMCNSWWYVLSTNTSPPEMDGGYK